MRKTISRFQTVMTAINYLAGRSVTNNKHHVLVACMPKSGSSLVTHMIGSLPSFRVASVVQGYDRNEHELSEIGLIRFNSTNYATQNHIRYSAPLQRLMTDFNVRPIVLTRNIFDIIVSMRDHFRNVSLVWPLAYVPDDIADWKDRDIDCFIADMMAPWYFNFYHSWLLCEEAIWLNYEDLKGNPTVTMEQLLRQLQIEIRTDELNDVLQQTLNAPLKTKNMGIVGRGQNVAPDAIERVATLKQYYTRDGYTDPLFERVFDHHVNRSVEGRERQSSRA